MRHTRSDGTVRPNDRTDFRRALTAGASFASAEGPLLVRQVEAGQLMLPSGRIIATDPCYLRWLDDTPPFVRTVTPGTYPVWLVMARLAGEELWAERVACLVLQLSEAPAVQWELALRPGEQLADLAPGQFYGHGVDSGNACFVDAAAVEALDVANREAIYAEGMLGRLNEDCWRSQAVNIPIPGPVRANLVACSSGYGDGAYPSWWGFDEARVVCALATDFFVLVEDRSAEARFLLREWADRTLIHPDLPQIGARVALPPVPPGASELRVLIDGNASCELAVADGAGQLLSTSGWLTVSADCSEHVLHCDTCLPDDAVLVLRCSLGVRGL